MRWSKLEVDLMFLLPSDLHLVIARAEQISCVQVSTHRPRKVTDSARKPPAKIDRLCDSRSYILELHLVIAVIVILQILFEAQC